MQTIEEVSAFLSVSAERLAKVVMFERDAAGTPVVAVIRGDLDVNEAKIARLMETMPEPAREETIRAIGAVPGYASAMNLTRCRIIADMSVVESSNLVCGANKADYHCLNFNLARDVAHFETADIASVVDGEQCPRCDGRLRFKRGIEVGNIFQLGSKYTASMGMKYLDKDGKENTPIMGCYGIGVGRLMASIIEARHDAFGPQWPLAVAPFSVHICAVNLSDSQKADFSGLVYNQLLDKGVDVIYDDRSERPGVQFADADLIGAPLRLICGAKNYADKKVEWKRRDNADKGMVDLADVSAFVEEFLAAEGQKVTGDRWQG
jgi:prolyl-tRNA synthetase